MVRKGDPDLDGVQRFARTLESLGLIDKLELRSPHTMPGMTQAEKLVEYAREIRAQAEDAWARGWARFNLPSVDIMNLIITLKTGDITLTLTFNHGHGDPGGWLAVTVSEPITTWQGHLATWYLADAFYRDSPDGQSKCWLDEASEEGLDNARNRLRHFGVTESQLKALEDSVLTRD